MGVGCALSQGGALIIRRKFSASGFWADAAENGATMFMYVGELCRFLISSDPVPAEKKHKIRIAIGNGLRPDVLATLRRALRHQAHHGILWRDREGNVGLLNLDSKPGAIGRIPPFLKHRFNAHLVKFDIEKEEPVRGKDGRCVVLRAWRGRRSHWRDPPRRCRATGLTAMATREATEKKLLRDVFKKGDLYFRTGDLMKRDKEGYFYFIDRIGDTFRWKGGECLHRRSAEIMEWAKGAWCRPNIYGVEVTGYPGRAAWPPLSSTGELDLDALHAHVTQELPAYARPVFPAYPPGRPGRAHHRHVQAEEDRSGERGLGSGENLRAALFR